MYLFWMFGSGYAIRFLRNGITAPKTRARRTESFRPAPIPLLLQQVSL